MDTICYCITAIFLFILFCIMKKSQNKIDIIPTIIITFLCILAYQVLTCWFLTIINIPINLYSLSVINMLFSICISIFIWKKGIQKFKIDKKDCIITFIIIIIISIISYKDMGNLENIRYYSTDASIHYIAAKEFYQNEKMLYQTDDTETPKQMMPMAYVNVGILFKAFSPLIGEMNLYKIFLLFDIIIFCFSGILFYFIIKNKIKNKIHILIAVIMTVFYLIGYPLNNLLNGFYYLGIGCLIVNAILYVLSQKEVIPIGIKRILLLLLNIGLIFSYSLFAPPVYLSMFIYDSYNTNKKYKKIFNKEFIFNTIIMLIIPGILGIVYLILPDIEKVNISIDGYIYKNLLINIFFFIPFTIYYLFIKIKNKKIDYTIIYFIILILYMIILYICTKFNIVSQYYFHKNSYILWSILLIYFFYGIIEFIQKYQKEKIIAITYLTIYTILAIFSITTNIHILYIFDIYENNNYLINYEENLVKDDIDMLKYIYDNNILSKTENNVLFIGDFMQEAWIRSIFKYRNRQPLERANHTKYIEKWNNKEIPYLVCFENSNSYNNLKNICEIEGRKLIFETKNAKIYEN